MPTSNFLLQGGDARFFKATSRILHSRNNQRLLLIDETLKDYVNTQPSDPVARLKLLLALNVRINNYINQHKDRTGAQKHGFRLPVVEQLKKEVDEAIQDCPKPVRTLLSPPPPPAPMPQGPVHNAQRAQANWALLRNGVQQVIPQGSLPKGTHANRVAARHLDVEDGYSNNWLEVLQKEHTRGDELFNHFEAWRKQLSTQITFKEYLGKLDPQTRESLTEYSVYYAHDLVARALFEAFLDGGKVKSRMTPELQDEIVKTRGADDARQRIRDLASKHREPQIVDTTEWPALGFASCGGKGWVCFVLSMYNTLYIGKHVSGTFHHSSLLAGAPILAAGMLKIVQGEITEIDGKNGHYKADASDLKRFVQYLKNQGVNLTGIRLVPFLGNPVTAESFLNGTNTPFTIATDKYVDMEEATGIKVVVQKPVLPKPVNAIRIGGNANENQKPPVLPPLPAPPANLKYV